MKNYTEKEIIELLQSKGLKVTQVETKHFKEKGYIQSGNPLKSINRTIEQIFETVTITGRGKKRVYTVGKELENVKERDDNRGRTISQAKINFMTNALGIIKNEELLNKPFTLSMWANKLGVELLPTSMHDARFTELINTLTTTFKLKHTNDPVTSDEGNTPFPRFRWFRTVDITKNFVERYNGRAKGMVENVFKLGKANNYIDYKVVYYVLKKGEYVEATETMYNDFKELETEVLNKKGFKYKNSYYQLAHEWVNYISKDKELITEEWEQFKVLYEDIVNEFVEKLGFEKAISSIIVTKLSGEVIEDGDVSYSKTLLSNDMVQDMHKRHFNSNSKTAQTLTMQSDFKKRFPYLVATVLLGRTDTEHMDNFEADLKGFIINFNRQMDIIEPQNVFYRNTEDVELALENEATEQLNAITEYKALIIQAEEEQLIEADKVATRELAKYELELDIEQAVETEAVYDAPQDVQSDYNNVTGINAINYQEELELEIKEDNRLIDALFG